MTDRFWLEHPEAVPVICMECGWSGVGAELKAQACPVCDGRVREIAPAPEDTEEAGYGLV